MVSHRLEDLPRLYVPASGESGCDMLPLPPSSPLHYCSSFHFYCDNTPTVPGYSQGKTGCKDRQTMNTRTAPAQHVYTCTARNLPREHQGPQRMSAWVNTHRPLDPRGPQRLSPGDSRPCQADQSPQPSTLEERLLYKAGL